MAALSFLGDISFNDEYNHLYEKGIKPFEQIEDVLSESDLVVGNLECLAKSSDGENTLKNPRLKTTLPTLNYLNNLNLGLVSLAHNHIYDNLSGGYKNTVQFLNDNKIHFLGAGLSPDEAERPKFLEIDGCKFCFLNYVTADTNPSLPAGSEIYLNMFDPQKVLEDIRAHKEKYFVIILLHWGGNVEGENFPHINQRTYARKFIDEGADLIIGHHSHTMQPYEKYNDKYIFYSLGNFCFADVYSDDSVKYWKEKKYNESCIVNVSVKRRKLNVEVIPIRNMKLFIRRDARLLNKFRRRNILFKIAGSSRCIWSVLYFYQKVISPIIVQLKRKDPNKTLIKRILTINGEKIKQLFK